MKKTVVNVQQQALRGRGVFIATARGRLRSIRPIGAFAVDLGGGELEFGRIPQFTSGNAAAMDVGYAFS